LLVHNTCSYAGSFSFLLPLQQHGLAVHGVVKGADGAIAAAAAEEQLEPPAEELLAAGRKPDDDDDIFGDAGTDYEPTVKKDKAAEAAEREARKGGYFGEDLHADLPPLPKDGAEINFFCKLPSFSWCVVGVCNVRWYAYTLLSPRRRSRGSVGRYARSCGR
jgi:hypothetical protein